jgi:hypothetical protein
MEPQKEITMLSENIKVPNLKRMTTGNIGAIFNKNNSEYKQQSQKQIPQQ